MNAEQIDIGNYQAVGTDGRGSITVLLPQRQMTAQQALVHAAWIVALAESLDETVTFAEILEAVRNT